MDSLEALSQYGVATVAIGALVWVVKFLGDIIRNHIAHNTEAQEELATTNQRLADAIAELLNYLRKSNGHKG